MGNISVYFVSYYRHVLKYNVGPNEFIAMQPLIIAFATPVFPVGNWLVDWFGNQSKPVIALGGFVGITLVLICGIFPLPP
jgi:hypothetical protein